MRHASATAVAGLTATVVGLLALIANEGAFFSGEAERIQLNISAFDCAEKVDDHVLNLGISPVGFFDTQADLVMEMDLTEYAKKRCEILEIRPRRAAQFDLSGGAYVRTDHRMVNVNPADPDALQRQDCDCFHLASAEAEAGMLRTVLPGALRRITPDAYSVSLSVGGVGETPILGAYGLTGYVAKDGWNHDVTFQLARFSRIVSMTSILFATLLGIGIGALFEAALSAATGRRLMAFGAALKAQRRKDSGNDTP